MRRLCLLVVLPALATADPISSENGGEAGNSTLVVDRQEGFRLPVSINDVPFIVTIVPVIGSARIVSSEVARKLGLKGGLVKGRADIGPVRLIANSGSARIRYGQVTDPGRIFWFDGPAAFALDGEFAPGSLPFEKVTFRIKPPAPREETISLGIDLKQHETIVHASPGVLLAARHEGQYTGTTRPAVIEYGIVRPVRPMTLAKPLPIGGLRLASVLVRVSDFGDASSIPDGQNTDENEIVVNAKSRRKTRHSIVFGTDFLNSCSQLTYDFRSMKVLLTCRMDGQA